MLAVISLDGNGSITTIDDESERQYATSWIAPRTRLDGPLTVATDLTIEENTEIGGELNVLNSFAAQGNCSLGNADTDRINIHGILTSQHTSGALEVNDTVHVTESLNVDGNVGIGRTDPAAKLTIQTPDSFTGNLIRFESKQAPNNYHLTLNAFSPTADVVSWQLNQFNLSSDFNPVLAIDRGNIGIGTTAPTGKLTVVGSGGNGRSVTMDSNEVKFRGDRLAHFSLFANRIGRTLTIENTSSNAFPGTAGTVLMALNTTGVGIGTTTPSTRLHVQSSLGGSDTVLGSYVALIENTNADRDPLRGGDVLALKIGNIVATSQNNFITFFRGNDSIAGRIEGGGSGGDAVFVSGSGDYAEYLPRLHPEETIAPGDIVGVVAGKITKTIAGAHQVMAISDRPIVVGNMPQKDQEALYEKVAFIGQVPINVRGNVRAGDYIIPSGKNDGTGIAIAPDQITPEAYVLVVGRAWEASEEEGIKRVNTVVGLPAHYPHLEELVATVQAQQAEIEALKAELNSLKALLLQRV
ncbi:MAG: hypothetical protein HC769_02695 [Cyanobacteria bacterium CRU_2_1]|nr:hypothetical protein [Cyanobacteria bacterium RU_5_0]NJR57853.1 hypothetical protein [Cyanobacteria bacterium CRU_2_1]